VSGLLTRRRAGVLLHPTSLHSPYGAGDLGHAAYRFVEFLAAAGFTVWQVLPLGPTHRNHSPYDSPSAFAGNPALISLDWLRDRALLEDAMLAALRERRTDRAAVLAVAADRFTERLREDAALEGDLAAFCERHAAWLPDYALFVALGEASGGAPWFAWEPPLRAREPAALEASHRRHAGRIAAVIFEQYVFERQWQELSAYARAAGVHFFGDMPIFVAHNSADVWAAQSLFLLEADGTLAVETGVPPDYFSAEGQRWGNPHYDWQAMARDGFAWWRQRIAVQRARADLIRIDHFRGFAACWEIPRTAATAASGRWVPAPGDALLPVLVEAAGQGVLVAENLGIITEDVEALRARYGLPGMRVIQFGFDGDAANPHLPHNHVQDALVYTGTHDNDTGLGWFQSLSPAVQQQVLGYFGWPGEAMPRPLLRAALASVSTLAILPMQDILGLDSSARMNRPGLRDGNWRWQLESERLDPALVAELRALLRLYGRPP
jgi:4-alpha-glucanotransferase